MSARSKSRDPSAPRSWRFFRAGGLDQVRLGSGADLAALDQLDQKLWAALACPTTGLDFDARSLALLDTDGDGRVRVPEVLAAVKWACSLLKNPDVLLKQAAVLPVDQIRDSSPEGAAMLACARKVLACLGKPDATEVSLQDALDAQAAFASSAFNGDSVVVEESSPNAGLRAAIRDIVECIGPQPDHSGKPGVSQNSVDRFFAEAQACLAWHDEAQADPAILPLKGDTAAAAAAVKAVQAKVDDYFSRCRLAVFEPRAVEALNADPNGLRALAGKDLTAGSSEVAALPAARVEPNKPLPLKTGVNPAWTEAIARLAAAAATPIAGAGEELTEENWETTRRVLQPYFSWEARQAGASVEKLGVARLRELVSGNTRVALGELIAADAAERDVADALASLQKLIRFLRDLYRLCINFVNFEAFYSRGSSAIFQAGTLYLDRRACHLCLMVQDHARHVSMASMAGTYAAYCDCVRRGTGEKLQIVAAVTDGDSDNLMVGRNGVFYDKAGLDWDATITRIVDNPISLRQAFWSPYKGFVRMVEQQIAKRASAAEARSSAKLENSAAMATSVDKNKPPETKKIDVGTVAALGVAAGAIGTFFAALMGYASGIVKLGPLAVVGAVIGVILLISGPSMVMAYIKLRKRNLGPLLDANGWAINAKARITMPLGAALTHLAKLPPGAQRDLADPYAEKRSVWPKVFVAALLLYAAYALLNHLGFIHEWTRGRIGTDRRAGAQHQAAPDRPQVKASQEPAGASE